MGSTVIVDTNVLSYMYKSHELAQQYVGYLQDKDLAMSFISLGELLAGAEIDKWGLVRRERLRQFIDGHAVLESNYAVAEHYASIMSCLRALGCPASDNDVWIAATAVAYGLPLVTHNRRHFEAIPRLELVSFS